MYKFLLCLMILLTVTIGQTQAESYQLNTHGKVGFYIKKLAIKVLQAEFEQVDSQIDLDEKSILPKHISFVIKVDSLKLNHETLHDMILGPDVFNAKQYQYITFQSTEIKHKGGEDYDVLGDLTIKGRSKPVVFKTKITPTLDQHHFNFKANTQIESHNFAMKSKFGSLTEHINIFVDGELILK